MIALSSLPATPMGLSASVANNGLAAKLNPLNASLTKNRGRGTPSVQPRTLKFQRSPNLSPFFSCPSAPLGRTASRQPFSYQSFPRALTGNGGCTPSRVRPSVFYLLCLSLARACEPADDTAVSIFLSSLHPYLNAPFLSQPFTDHGARITKHVSLLPERHRPHSRIFG